MVTPARIVDAAKVDRFSQGPAISYTRSIPYGVNDVEVLVLGRADIKNLLYTAYHEVGVPERHVRITFVAPGNLIGLHVTLLSLVTSLGKTLSDADLEDMWEIFHYATLSTRAYETLRGHLQHLSNVHPTWENGPFAAALGLGSAGTWVDVKAAIHNTICKYSTNPSSTPPTGQAPSMFRPFVNDAAEDFARSAAPLGQRAAGDLRRTVDGLEIPPESRKQNLLYQDDEEWASPWNTLSGYHLATAYTPLTEMSPLRVDSSSVGDDHKALSAAKTQFREWIKSLSEALGQRQTMSINFVVADPLAYCESLHRLGLADQGPVSYAYPGSGLPLSPNPEWTKEFDAIEAANITGDRMTTLMTLACTGPLLKDAPWATLHSEFTLKMGEMRENPLEDILYSSMPAMLLLLGVSSVEVVTNANTVSIVDEVLLGIADDVPLGNQTSCIHYRICWKQNKYLSECKACPLRMDAKQLVNLLLDLDYSMYMTEQRGIDPTRVSGVSPPHRIALLAGVLETAAQHVEVPISEVGRMLFETAGKEEKRPGIAQEVSELAIELHRRGIYSDPLVTQPASASGPYDDIGLPTVVAVSVGFSGRNEPIFRDTIFEARIHEKNTKSHIFRNLHAISHVEFDSSGPPEPNRIQERRLTLSGVSTKALQTGNYSHVATFWAPTALLLGNEVEVEILGMPYPPVDSVYGVSFFRGKPFRDVPKHGPGVVITEHMPTAGPPAVEFSPSPRAPSITPVNPHASLQASVDATTQDGVQFTLQFQSTDGTASLVGRQNLRSEKGKGLLADKAPISLRQATAFTMDVVFGKAPEVAVYTLHFPWAVTTAGSKTRIARTSGYVEVVMPFAAHGEKSPLSDFMFPTRLGPNSIPTAMNTPHVNLDRMPSLDVADETAIKWITTLTSFQFSSQERVARDKANEKTGMSQSLRVNFKESLFAMFMTSTGLQGGQTGLFVLNVPGTEGTEGVHMIILVSAVRLDCAANSIVLDAAVVPITTEMLKDDEMEGFLLVLRTLEICSLDVDEKELALWKKILPSLAERCRTWTHLPTCEYKSSNATIPVSIKSGAPVLCSCGNGKIPEQFISLPGWEETASKYATRIAISPTYACPFVEKMVDFGVLMPADVPKCRNCGKRERDLEEGGRLKKCLRCLKVVYCGPQCQKKDWKKHRHECKEAEEHGKP